MQVTSKLALTALVVGMAMTHTGPAAAQDLVLDEGDEICASYNDCATVMTYNGRQRLVPTDRHGRPKMLPGLMGSGLTFHIVPREQSEM